MSYIARTVLPFLCGVVASINATVLLGVNPNYDAAWWKVFLALVLAAVIPLLYPTQKETPDLPGRG